MSFRHIRRASGLLLPLVLSACLTNGQRIDADINSIRQSSQFQEHSFSSPQLGISFKLPECLEAVADTQTQKYVDDAKNGSKIPEAYQRTAVLLNALCVNQDGQRSAFTLIAEAIPEGVTAAMYAKQGIKNALPRPNATLDTDVHPETFAGQEFQVYDTTVTGGQVKMKQHYLTAIVNAKGNVAVTIILMGSDDSMMLDLRKQVEPTFRITK